MDSLMFWLAALWRGRVLLLGFTLTGLLAGLLASVSAPSLFTSQVTLQVDARRNLSPLLADLQNKEHVALLNDLLANPELLDDTARDTGVVINPAGLALTVPSPRLIRIRYSSADRHNLERAADALAYNFIYEVLAPERLRLEQRLTTLKAKTDAPDATPEQRKAAEEELVLMQEAVQAIAAAFDQGTPQAVMWFAEPARMLPYTPRATRHWRWATCGLTLGLMLALLLVVARALNPRGPRTDAELAQASGLPVLGLWPDIGTVRVQDGVPVVIAGQTTLQPTSFTELSRLHRQLTRGLHGALVMTGVAGGEGTSLLALLLAQRSAQGNKKTLLVDLNMRNTGLTHALGQAATPWKIGKRKRTDSLGDVAASMGKNLDFLPAPEDSDSIAWLRQPENAQKWLDGLTSVYEHIIIDTTPVLALNRQNADPVVLVAAAARSVLVVMMAQTPFDKVRQVGQLLARSGNVLGVIGNNRLNPAPRQVVLEAIDNIGRVMPGLGSWLRAKVRV